MLDKVINRLDNINILSDLHLLAIQTGNGQAAHGWSVHLLDNLRINVRNNSIVDLKGMLDIKEYLHGTIVLITIVQPTRCFRTEIESGTKQTVISAVRTKLANVKDGEIGMGTMLDSQRLAVGIDNLGEITVKYILEGDIHIVIQRNNVGSMLLQFCIGFYRLHTSSCSKCDMGIFVITLWIVNNQNIYLVGSQTPDNVHPFLLTFTGIHSQQTIGDSRMIVEFIRQLRRIVVFQTSNIIHHVGTVNRRLLPITEPILEIITFNLLFLLLTEEILIESLVSSDTGERILAQNSGILNIDSRGCDTVIQRINLVQKVVEDAVSNLFLVGIVDAEELCDITPELTQNLHHLTHDGIGILLAIDKLLQPLIAALATELSQSFIGYLVIGLQMGIILDDIVPDLRGVLHHPNNILPLLGIALTQHLSPQVGVLMKRSLGSSNTRVNINGAIMYETISLMCSATEEHRLALHDILLHLVSDINSMGVNLLLDFISREIDNTLLV